MELIPMPAFLTGLLWFLLDLCVAKQKFLASRSENPVMAFRSRKIIDYTGTYKHLVALGGVVVIVLAIGHRLRWFKPGIGGRIFKGDKNP
jgi:hypothetical protein